MLLWRPFLFSAVLLCSFLQPQSQARVEAATECNFFEGDVLLKAVWHLPEHQGQSDYDVGDFEMELLGPVTYHGCDGSKHEVEKGRVVNGASIPRAAWSFLNYTPWSGRTQRPAIVHDVLCEDVRYSSDYVHSLFHASLIAEGVDARTAGLMYAAVSNWGPQWSEPGGEVTRPDFKAGLFLLFKRLIMNNETIVARRTNEPVQSLRKTILTLQRANTESVLFGSHGDRSKIDRMIEQLTLLRAREAFELQSRGRIRVRRRSVMQLNSIGR